MVQSKEALFWEVTRMFFNELQSGNLNIFFLKLLSSNEILKNFHANYLCSV